MDSNDAYTTQQLVQRAPRVPPATCRQPADSDRWHFNARDRLHDLGMQHMTRALSFINTLFTVSNNCSGIKTFELATGMVGLAFDLPPMKSLWCCEKDDPCQAEILQDSDDDEECLFNDVWEFLHPKVQSQLLNLEHNNVDEKRCLIMGSTTMTEACCIKHGNIARSNDQLCMLLEHLVSMAALPGKDANWQKSMLGFLLLSADSAVICWRFYG